MFVRTIVAIALAGLAQGQPMTSAEKNAVGAALSDALGVMSGKVQSGSKFSICMQMFPDGPPPNAAKDVSWQTCKGIVPSTKSKRSALILSRKQPLSGAERSQVANALSDALSVMSGKKESVSKYQSCVSLFPNGKPADAATSGTWQACKEELSAGLVQRAVKILRQADPLTSQEKQEVGNALTSALKAIQGKGGPQDLWEICDSMFPDGKRPASTSATDPTWVACKGNLYTAGGVSLASVKKH